MTVYYNGNKIKDITLQSEYVQAIYNGSKLVYERTVDNYLYCKHPDFSNIVSFSNNTQFVAPSDGWLDVTYNSGDVNVYWDLENATTSTPNIAYARQAGGVTGSKGGALVYIPKGSHILGSNAGGLRFIQAVDYTRGLPYSKRDKACRVPDWSTGVSVAQNSTVEPLSEPRWLNTFGSTRKVEVSYDGSTWITIAEGVTSGTVEPSAAFYIPAGCYCRTTGTLNAIYTCLKES